MESEMALFLPKRLLAERQRKAVAPIVGCYVGYQDLTGEHVEIADAVSELVRFRRSDVIRNIAWLLSRAGSSYDQESQFALGRGFLDEELYKALCDYARRTTDHPWVVFHRQTLWYLFQFTILCCREGHDEPAERALKEAIGRACLIASDCLEQSPESCPSESLPENDREAAWMSILLSIRDIKGESLRPEMLTRAKLFWLDIPRQEHIRRLASAISVDADFDAVFERAHGIPLCKFLTSMVACYAFFLEQAEGNPKLLDPKRYFGTIGEAEVAERALLIVSRTPDAIARMLVNEPRQSWSRDFTPLRQHPLVEILPGKFACPDVSFLCRYLCDGVYWLLVDAFGNDHEKFRALFGHVFEQYINRLIEQFTYGGNVLVRNLYPRPTFSDGAEVADCIIHWGDTALLVECKAGLLTTRQKYAGLPDVLMKGIDDLFLRDSTSSTGRRTKKGIGQLADSIGRILTGEQVLAGDRTATSVLDLSRCRLIPAVITFDETLGLHPIQRRAQRKLRELLSRKHIDFSRVAAVLILTVEDVEVIQDLQNITSIKPLVLDYAGYLQENTGDLIGTFRDFAYNKFPRHKIDKQSFIRETAATLFEETIDQLKIPRSEEEA